MSDRYEMTKYGPSGSSFSFGSYRANEGMEFWRSPLREGKFRVPVVYCHGAGGTTPTTREVYREDFASLNRLGHDVITADLGGLDTWGNVASSGPGTNAVDQAITFANTTYNTRTDKVLLFADSMGALVALNWAWRNPTKIGAIALRAPVVALQAFHERNEAFFGTSMHLGYGNHAGVISAYPTRDPQQNLASILPFGARIRAWYCTTDEFIPPSEVTTFITAVGGSLGTPIVGGHLNLAACRSDETSIWLARFGEMT